MWGKTTNFENGVLSPLIVSIPGMSNKGKTTDALVEYVDIFPSILDAAGYEIPSFFEGTSFIPLIDNINRSWKNAAFSQHERGLISEQEGYTVRTSQFRYTEWWDNENDTLMAVELYDHTIDSLESVNVAYQKEYQEMLGKMKLVLQKGWKAALPEGIINNAKNKPAPRSMAWGPEGESRRLAWQEYLEKKKKEGKKPRTVLYRY
jgi:arylsulfatase A-like enzyme